MNQKRTIIMLAVIGGLVVGASVGISSAAAQPDTTTSPEPTTTTPNPTTNSSTTTTSTTTSAPSTTGTTAAGESQASSTSTATPSSTSTSGADSTESESEDCVTVTDDGTEYCLPAYSHEINSQTEVVAVDWSGETVTLAIRSDNPQRITVTDSNSIESSGSGEVTFVSETIGSGTSVVQINAEEESGDKTLTIGTADDLDYLSNPEEPFLEDGISQNLLYITGAGGAASIFLVGYLFYRYKRYKIASGWKNVFDDYSP